MPLSPHLRNFAPRAGDWELSVPFLFLLLFGIWFRTHGARWEPLMAMPAWSALGFGVVAVAMLSPALAASRMAARAKILASRTFRETLAATPLDGAAFIQERFEPALRRVVLPVRLSPGLVLLALGALPDEPRGTFAGALACSAACAAACPLARYSARDLLRRLCFAATGGSQTATVMVHSFEWVCVGFFACGSAAIAALAAALLLPPIVAAGGVLSFAWLVAAKVPFAEAGQYAAIGSRYFAFS